MYRLAREKLNFITNDEKVKTVITEISKIAPSDIPVLISGESGTGKEIVANFIHLMSNRKERPFIAINCAAIPSELLESELFGHKKGSFTGAASDRRGLLEMADGGTVFLDEIGDMPLLLQAKLLRIIQDKKIRRLGESSEKQVNFRIVSATHKRLKDEIKAGKFREDLYYRLCGYSFNLPALRQRPGDIRSLIQHFTRRSSEKYSVVPPEFPEAVIEKLERYSWPGNIRQLENVIEQMTVRYQGTVIEDFKDFEADDSCGDEDGHDTCFCNCQKLPTLAELTDRYIDFVSQKVNHHQGEAARILGISRRTISRKTKDNHELPNGHNADKLSDVRL